jgi:predicted amidohydrolase
MTENGNHKRRVRARAAKTGESYTTALMHVRQSSSTGQKPEPKSVRLAVAQTTYYDDPRNITELRSSGVEMRRLMREAHKAGARILHFPEGTICSPAKLIMSINGPQEVGPSDWSRVEWTVLREELDATRTLARELGLWTIIGSVHRLSQPHRPHNSLYVISDRGELVTRYDERMLSNTKISFMYTPGKIPVTFEVDGICFGCTLGMEMHYPEIFMEYGQLNVDCVLFSTTGETSIDVYGNSRAFAVEAQGHATSNTYWVSFSAHAPRSLTTPSGIVAPDGQWAAQCSVDGKPSIAVMDINNDTGNFNRPWRRMARSGIYKPHLVDGDPRSEGRNMF